MKKLYTLLVIFIATTASAQLDLHKDGQPLGDTWAIDSATVGIDHFQQDLYIINNGATPMTIGFKRVRNYHTFGWTDQICDNLLCFNCADITTWERPTSPALTVNPGDSSIFQLKVYPEGIMGCAIYTYYVLDDAKVIQDSVTVTYTINGQSCFLGADEQVEDIDYSVYPNPASDVLNVRIANASSNDVLVIYNILGEEVNRIELSEGVNKMDISELNSGVYFYSLLRNNDLVETKKLVIRH